MVGYEHYEKTNTGAFHSAYRRRRASAGGRIDLPIAEEGRTPEDSATASAAEIRSAAARYGGRAGSAKPSHAGNCQTCARGQRIVNLSLRRRVGTEVQGREPSGHERVFQTHACRRSCHPE